MTGWCPVHDRFYEAADGSCPRCGSALVEDTITDEAAEPVTVSAVAESSGQEDEIAEPPPRRPAVYVAVAAACVVVAFVAGLAFPNADRPAPPTRPSAKLARSDLTVGVSRQGAGLVLRLESFEQEGRRIVARVTVPPGEDLDLGRIQTADLELMTEGGQQNLRLPVRTTVSGFVIEGLALPSGELPVTGLRIFSLNLKLDSIFERSVSLDLDGVWPATRASQPRARSVRARLDGGDGRSITLTGLVGWEGRLEASLSISGANPDWTYVEEYRLDLGDRGSIAGTLYTPSSERAVVFFENVPSDVDRMDMHHRVEAASINGEWLWIFR